MTAVKTPPRSRREKATATRRRIIDAAYRLFAESGYASTTMDAIAAEAGVAVQTVYHVFNTKAALLQAVVPVASAGQHDPPPSPGWLQDVLDEPNARRALALTIENGVGMSARVAPLVPAVNAATSTDPAFADFWDAACIVRREGTAQIVARLAGNGQLRPGLDPQRGADALYAIGSYETISAFLSVCGWSLEETKAWYYQLACDQLLPDDARGVRARGDRPTRGLSFDQLVSD
jgi:AcrR family transcriptional regulator